MSLDERADELDRKLEEHPAEEAIRVLTRDAQKRKRQVNLLTATVILTLVMAVGLSFVSYKLYKITRLTQSNQDAVVQNCETANDSRKNQLALWNYVFSITPRQPRTPEQEQQNDKFKAFVEKTFAQRNCQAEIK